MPISPHHTLPHGYSSRAVLGPQAGSGPRLGLAAVGCAMIALAWALIERVVGSFRPDVLAFMGGHLAGMAGGPAPESPSQVALLLIVSTIPAFILVVVVHEAVHFACFWLLSGSRPGIGFTGDFAFVAAPDGLFLSRNRYLASALAPLLVLTVLGLAAVRLVPLSMAWIWVFFLLFNVAGSVSDVRVAAWLLRHPASARILDGGEVMTVFAPGPVPSPPEPAGAGRPDHA